MPIVTQEQAEIEAAMAQYGIAEQIEFQKELERIRTAEAAGRVSPWTGFGEAIGVAAQGVGKWLQLSSQRDKIKFEAEIAKLRIQQGITGRGVGPTMGGLSWLTILAFGGVAIFALLVLKKGMF